MIERKRNQGDRECYEPSCRLSLGKAVSADAILVVTVSRVGSVLGVAGDLIDVKRQTTRAGGFAECAAEPDSGRLDRVREALASVADQVAGVGAVPPAADRGESPAPPLRPPEDDVRPPPEDGRVPFDPGKERATVPAGTTTAGKAGLEWVKIPGGTFKPSRQDAEVVVKPFEMTRSEVTVDQYAACVAANGCSEPDTGEGCNWLVPGRGRHPINCVDWHQARGFCTWSGGRLPWEVEWEFEASAGGTRQYPWGDAEPTCDLAVMDEVGYGCEKQSTWPVCSKDKGRSRNGICDLAGNVWEWVEDHRGSLRVARGGSWWADVGFLRASGRDAGQREYRHDDLGFRCLRSFP
jgi:iron(II)-dependent oxidoreductase